VLLIGVAGSFCKDDRDPDQDTTEPHPVHAKR
jgi:hypothetical protein